MLPVRPTECVCLYICTYAVLLVVQNSRVKQIPSRLIAIILRRISFPAFRGAQHEDLSESSPRLSFHHLLPFASLLLRRLFSFELLVERLPSRKDGSNRIPSYVPQLDSLYSLLRFQLS